MLENVNISTLSSSSSISFRTTAEAGFELEYPDPSKSPALSTTSTAEGGGSSPILPPLPEPTINGHTLHLLRTPPSGPPSEPRTDTSVFYTASWGSPYLDPFESSVGTRSVYRSAYSEASEDSEDLPIRHLELHTPFLRPPPPFTRSQTEPDFVSHDGLISAAVLANRARRPAHRLTEDWIRQHTGGESTERNNWLSDDQAESENSSLSGSFSGDAADSLHPESDPRTPTLHRVLPSGEQSMRRHRRQDTGETLTQADIVTLTEQETPNMATKNENASEARTSNGASNDEKPLPPPPQAEQWATKALPRPTSSSSTLPPRPKKKIPWKGKNILVLLPWDNERGKRGGPPKPMTAKDVAAMLKDWEQLGYDTTGFNLGADGDGEGDSGPGQSCIDWPLRSDIEVERAQRSFRVSIPDRREWDAYVEELKEAKLRALGVSLGDDDPLPTISPAIPNLSRRTSMQYPSLPFSPPLPTSSAASSHLAHNSHLPFSPAMIAGNGLSTSQSSNQGSIASPASMHAHLHGKLGMRHNSVSFGPSGDHPFGSPFQYPRQSSPGVWSPQQMLYQHGHRGGSPSMHNLGSIISPASPLSQDGYPPPNDLMSQRQLLLQNQLLAAGPRVSPRLQEVRESEDEHIHEMQSKSPSKTPEARQPIKHNSSASLQEEIDAAEYHLEEQFQRQLDGDDYSPHSNNGDMDKAFENKPAPHVRTTSIIGGGIGSSRFVDDSREGPVLHHPQPHNRGHSLSQRPFQDTEDISSGESKNGLRGAKDAGKYDLSDIETNPSNLGTPTLQSGIPVHTHDRNMSVASNPWIDAESIQSKVNQGAHRSKPSMSTLNVAAKPFKFDPSSSFQPSQFSFINNNNFQPTTSVNFATYAPQGHSFGGANNNSNHVMKNSFSKVNAAAPAFAPATPAFTPNQSDFNFTGPTFRPDAPTFTPFSSNNFSNSMSDTSGNEAHKSSIFGNIDLNAIDVSRAGKKSKAIPIVRPDSSHEKENESQGAEDEWGRPKRDESRVKRIRGTDDDGTSVPVFAEPSLPLGEATWEQSPPKNVSALATQADKENLEPVGEESEELPEAGLGEQAEQGETEFEPFEFHQQKLAEEFNAARPFSSHTQDSGKKVDDSEDDESVLGEQAHSKTSSISSQYAHKKSTSSLSANAKSFEFQPAGNVFFTSGESNAPKLAPVAPPLPKTGLASSRYASSPTRPAATTNDSPILQPEEAPQFQNALPQPQSPPQYEEEANQSSELEEGEIPESPTFEEIDAMMTHMNQAERSMAGHMSDSPGWHQSSPTRQIQLPIPMSSPIRLNPQQLLRSDAPSPSPRRYNYSAVMDSPDRIYGQEQDDPFADPHSTAALGSPVHRLNTGTSLPVSDWDDVLSEGEEIKLQERVGFFDNHVNDVVGGLLAERLDPMEKALEAIQMSLQTFSHSGRAPSHRRDRRSLSGALSDADDEDDEDPQSSMSPRRNTKLDKIRTVVLDALNTHQSRPQSAITPTAPSAFPDSHSILQAVEEMKQQFDQSMRPDFRAENLKTIVEEAIENRMPAASKTDDSLAAKLAEAEARIATLEEESRYRLEELEQKSEAKISELQEKLHRADEWVEEEIRKRRSAEDSKAMTERLMASSLEEETRLRHLVDEKTAKAENEIIDRRKAEDQLAEVQRLLRIASEEEDRLRDVLMEKDAKVRQISEERDYKVRSVEESRGKTTMRIAMLETAQENARKTEADLTATIHMAESELRESRALAHRWQLEAESAMEAAKRHSDDAEQANETNRDLRRTIETLKNQMEESIRVRESMRSKLMDLQEDMARAARNISHENSRRAKKEQELLARQEVLDAKLQAEARTRERLEMEIERLESGERQGMRAVSECKRLEALVAELRDENHAAQKDVLRYKREFGEARESGLAEVQRTRKYMQVEVDSANNQVNVVREELENQILSLRNQIDLVKLDAETAKEQHEMLLEEAQSSKQRMVDELRRKHQDEIEDMETQHARRLNNAIEDAQRSEQHLLERLSLSTAKTEHLQDRVSHLEDKLEIAKSAAQAAAGAAKAARSASGSLPSPAMSGMTSRAAEAPEKISPQALRESIMVLQEQLQDRELKIESLEQQLSGADPDTALKISKRDDEIMWLRELLSVRKSDLQDIVSTLSQNSYDPDSVRDAAIRLSANLQMEEQERERAMNGGSALNLPNIAASIAASPRVAQVANAVGPLAAAWGNWTRKTKEQNKEQNMPANARKAVESNNNSTPSKAGSSSGFLSGLMTPPASNNRLTDTPPGAPGPVHPRREPTAFARENSLSAFNATGQRFTAGQLMGRPGISTPRRADKVPVRREVPSTPPIMKSSSYDSDAVPRGEEASNGHALGMSLGEELGDFGSDAGFYDDDESTVDEMAGIYSGGFGR
ncbi:hypothetical protein CJF30_00010362 [Rutstroemia sp. NJR-2017a BBW]|nr:hypothetical protein CJF30_00010362 [Rutstroemia sp. NJR-2017a BBW]